MSILKTLSSFSGYYIKNNLSKIDPVRFQRNENYAQKMFFHYWAFERANAPRGFRVAAVKVVEALRSPYRAKLNSILKEYFHGKDNKKNNPLLDERLKEFNVKKIVSKIKDGEIEGAFNELALNGINHKIRSFFIRDCLFILDKEDIANNNIEKCLFAFPIDIWVEKTLECLFDKYPSMRHKEISRKKYGNLGLKKFNLAATAIKQCYKEKLSPLRLNMGIWYYCANFVADEQRLKYLLKDGDKAVRDEAKPFKDLL